MLLKTLKVWLDVFTYCALLAVQDILICEVIA